MQYMRRLPLHNAFNVRDLGGYAIDESRITNWQMIFRADGLHLLDEHDWKYLEAVGIKYIIDLRSLSEATSEPYHCETYGIKYRSLPFMKDAFDHTSVEEHESMEHNEFLDSLKLDYVEMLEDASEVLKLIFEAIAVALREHVGVLFHCSAGKDRTGILSVLLLELCGVNEFDILADYQVSNTYNTLGINKTIFENFNDHPNISSLLSSSTEMMKPLLQKLHKVGCKQYLIDVGVDERDLTTIVQSFISKV